jgi:serine/threonine protein phosphatase PrpC
LSAGFAVIAEAQTPGKAPIEGQSTEQGTGEQSAEPSEEKPTEPSEEQSAEPSGEQPAEPVADAALGLFKKPFILFDSIAALCVIAGVIVVVKKRGGNETASVTAAQRSAEPAGIQAANIQGVGSRESQQDSFGVTDITNTRRGVFAVVADGMGGAANGAEISRIVTSHMLRAFQSAQSEANDPAALLLRMVSGAQDEARAYIERQGNQTSGSTVVAVIVKEGGFHFISVGDSRVCLLRGGALVQLNREHTCASELDERAARGEISLEAARNDPQRGALTSYIGLEGQLQIDSNHKPIPILSGDRLLLMSDGVFGTLTDAELAEAAGTVNVYEAGAAIERAVLAKQRPNQDNFTAILLEL